MIHEQIDPQYIIKILKIVIKLFVESLWTQHFSEKFNVNGLFYLKGSITKTTIMR